MHVERWWWSHSGVKGDQVSDLMSDLRYPSRPQNKTSLPTFYSENVHSRFGQRMRAYLLAPETASFSFRASCESACKVKMSNVHVADDVEEIINIRDGETKRQNDFIS